MNPFKRIELWVLLAMIVAGMVYVFTSNPGGGDGPLTGTGTGGPAPKDKELVLHKSTLERDYGNVRLDIDLKVRNDSSDKLVMQSPAVRLLASSGKEVPSFFLPFDALPEIPAKSSQDVQLRYWLSTDDLKGPLTLEVKGKTLEVKSAQPVDIATLKNGEKKVIKGTVW